MQYKNLSTLTTQKYYRKGRDGVRQDWENTNTHARYYVSGFGVP